MKKLTTKLMIATAALVVAAGVASAQTMTASIPFEFRAGNRVMEPGTYWVGDLQRLSGAPIYRILNQESHKTVVLMPQAPVDREKAWEASGQAKLVFACTSGSCALAEIYTGSGSHAYSFRGSKPANDETAVLKVIPLQSGKGE